MDLIFRLLEFLIRSALNEGNQKQSPAGRTPAAVPTRTLSRGAMPGMPAASRAAASKPMAPQTRSSSSDPVYDDGGWRAAVTVLGLILLFVLVAFWILQTQIRGG